MKKNVLIIIMLSCLVLYSAQAQTYKTTKLGVEVEINAIKTEIQFYTLSILRVLKYPVGASFEKHRSEWAELREAQTMALAQPNTAMACTIDIGEADNIHPKNKQEVGKRLALCAAKMVYKHNLVSSGPLYKSYKVEGKNIRISFSNIGSGLKSMDGKVITGFAIAGADKQFYWAEAVVKNNDVIVFSKNVLKPMAIRYAWADNPDCNLMNAEGLPAIPFRTDDWKGITQK